MRRAPGSTYQDSPRPLHPVAWWLWALGLTVAASRTTNPVLLTMVVGVVCWVVVARRSDAPWARAFRLYVIGGLLIVAIRVFFRVVFAGNEGDTVLVPLPTFALPKLAAGIHLFGDVTAESLLGGLYDGLRLATMVICLGAANALANPRRLLRSMPPALHEVSTAVVVALSVFPQLAESVVRVGRARRLRPVGHQSRMSGMRMVVVPVLEDALDRSLLLAASMDSRGYGRSGARSRLSTWVAAALMMSGLGGLCVGVYCLLDATTPRLLATPLMALSLVVGVAGIVASGRGVTRTSYRPDRWRSAELVVVASGLAAGALVYVTTRTDPANLNPSLNPLAWPRVSLLPMLGILIGLVPSVATPLPVPTSSAEAAV